MKLEIYGQSKPEQVVRLMLRMAGEDVELCAVNEEAEFLSTLLAITSEGKLQRPGYIDRTLGFELDGLGRLAV